MSPWKIGSWLVFGLSALAGVGVQAQTATTVVTSSPATLTATPSPYVSVPVTFTFDGTFDMAGFLLEINYNADALRFQESASSFVVGGTTFSWGAWQADLALKGSTYSFDSAEVILGNYFGLGSYGYANSLPESYALPAGPLVFNAAFLPLVNGGSSEVTVSMTFSDPNFVDLPSAPQPTTTLLAVTAVPEPETWLMMLCGAGLVASLARRRLGRTGAIAT